MSGLGNAAYITATSAPNPDNDWSCNDWMVYHQQLVKEHGRDRANELWDREWQKQGGLDYSVNWCKYNGQWVNYFQSQGLDKRSIFSMVFTGAGNVLDNTIGTAEGVTKSAKNTANVLKWALPAAILIVGGGVIWYLAQKRNVIGDVALNKLKK